MFTLNPTLVEFARSSLRAAITSQSTLVINGPQSCGKTMLAKLLAAEYGSYAETDGWTITKKLPFFDVLQSEPQTVIVDDFNPLDPIIALDGRLEILKGYITSPEITIHSKGKDQRNMRTPNFIFCTGMEIPFSQEMGNRRFTVFRMGATA